MWRLAEDSTNSGSDADFGFDKTFNNPESTEPISEADREIFSDETSQNLPNTRSVDPGEKERRLSLIEEAKKIMRRGPNKVPTRLAARVGAPKEIQKAIRSDTKENRDKVKDFANKKIRKLAQDKIGSKIADKGLKTGFKKGLSKGAGKATKEGAKRLGKEAGKQLGKAAGKAGAKLGVKGLQAGVAATGAGTGAATFGLGFLLSLLLNIAISLGVSDAVDALFELKNGDPKQATYLAIRAATKIGMFVWLLITLVFLFSIGGLIIGVPLLVVLNIYMILGLIPSLKWIPQLQGFVWWERAIIIVLDIFAFLFVISFIAALGWYLCNTSGLGGGGVQGAVVGAVVSFYDWWQESQVGSVAADFCRYVNKGTQ